MRNEDDCNQEIAVSPFFKGLVYGYQYSIIILNDKGGEGDEDFSNQSYFV